MAHKTLGTCVAVEPDAPSAPRAALPVRQAAGEWVWSMPGEADQHTPPLTFPRPDNIDDEVERLLDGAPGDGAPAGGSPAGAAYAADSPAASDTGEDGGPAPAVRMDDGVGDCGAAHALTEAAGVADAAPIRVGFMDDTVEGVEGEDSGGGACAEEMIGVGGGACVEWLGGVYMGSGGDAVEDAQVEEVGGACAAETGEGADAGDARPERMSESGGAEDASADEEGAAGAPSTDGAGEVDAARGACPDVDMTGGETVAGDACADQAVEEGAAGAAEVAFPEPPSAASVQMDEGGAARSHSWCVLPGEGSDGGSAESVGSCSVRASGDGPSGPDAFAEAAVEIANSVGAPAPGGDTSAGDAGVVEEWIGGEGGAEADAHVRSPDPCDRQVYAAVLLAWLAPEMGVAARSV